MTISFDFVLACERVNKSTKTCKVTEQGELSGNSKKNGYAFLPSFLSSLSCSLVHNRLSFSLVGG